MHTYIDTYIHTGTYKHSSIDLLWPRLHSSHASIILSNHYSVSRCVVRVCINNNTSMHTYIHTYIKTYIKHTSKRTYIPTHIHTYMHTYIHAYIQTYMQTYIHTYMYTCIHTYRHTYRSEQMASSRSQVCKKTLTE